MIGAALLALALLLYIFPKWRWMSFVLYIGFMYDGYQLLPDVVTEIKNVDLGVTYTAIISAILLFQRKYAIPKVMFRKSYFLLLVFLSCSFVFSYNYYDIDAYSIVQGGRAYLLLLSFPILATMGERNFRKVLKTLLWITTITSVLFIGQVTLGKPLMPYSYEAAVEDSVGYSRFYNTPPLLSFFLVLSFLYPKLYGWKLWPIRAILFTALVATFGRTEIAVTVVGIGLALILNGKVGLFLRAAIFVGVMLLPFQDVLLKRFEKGDTKEDIQSVLEGGAVNYNPKSGATMTFRLAMLMERIDYLKKRPMEEQVFGMGLVTDSYPKLHLLYNFDIGLNDKQGNIAQSRTSDISYTNLIMHWGFGGTALYLLFYLAMVFYLFKRRKRNPYICAVAALSLMMLITAFSSSSLSEPRYFAIYFLVMSTLFPEAKGRSWNINGMRKPAWKKRLELMQMEIKE